MEDFMTVFVLAASVDTR